MYRWRGARVAVWAVADGREVRRVKERLLNPDGWATVHPPRDGSSRSRHDEQRPGAHTRGTTGSSEISLPRGARRARDVPRRARRQERPLCHEGPAARCPAAARGRGRVRGRRACGSTTQPTRRAGGQLEEGRGGQLERRPVAVHGGACPIGWCACGAWAVLTRYSARGPWLGAKCAHCSAADADGNPADAGHNAPDRAAARAAPPQPVHRSTPPNATTQVARAHVFVNWGAQSAAHAPCGASAAPPSTGPHPADD